ncbi:hypothetical protein DEO72_LG4g1500 [Vigna unguiculata]|uniref:Uncharacterized protein n=1 Tax=Vigna unguiculata TaxID=3917 RepID=A0A4D6LRD7_VIGUN|nr:hypothetical protein DEO72_LG4g1500 [Vigna unguiculata]
MCIRDRHSANVQLTEQDFVLALSTCGFGARIRDSGIRFRPRSFNLLNRCGGKKRSHREGDDVRPVESGENSHAVSEFEVLGTEIVVWSAPPEDVTSAPVDDARNEDTEIGSDEGEVVDSLRRCGEEEVGVKNVGTVEEEVGGENVGTCEEEAGVENLGTDEAEVGGENLGTGEEEAGVENVGTDEAEVGGENLGTGEAEVGVDKGLDNERDCDDERVEVDSWIDSDADCIGDSDGDEWERPTEAAATQPTQPTQSEPQPTQPTQSEAPPSQPPATPTPPAAPTPPIAAPTPPAPGPPPNTAVQQPSQPSYGIRKMRPKMQIRRPPRPS